MPFLQNTRQGVRDYFLETRSFYEALARILLLTSRLLFYPKYRPSYTTFFIHILLFVIVHEWSIVAPYLSRLRTYGRRCLARIASAYRSRSAEVHRWVRILIVAYIVFLLLRIAITPRSIIFVVKRFLIVPPYLFGLFLGRGLKQGFLYAIEQLRQYCSRLLYSLLAWYLSDVWNSEAAWWIFNIVYNPYTIAAAIVIFLILLIWLILAARSKSLSWYIIFWAHLIVFTLILELVFPILPIYVIVADIIALSLYISMPVWTGLFI